jgi:hypothetical protein
MDKSILTEEINNMRFLFGYKPGKLISEQETPATPATPANVSMPDLIGQIQTILNTKFGGQLNVDRKWGPKTQAAFENAIKTIESPAASPATGPDATQMECIKQYGQNPTLGIGAVNTKVWLPNSDGSYSWFGKDYSFEMASNKFTDESVGTWACNSGKLTITLKNKQTWTDGKWSGDPFMGIAAAAPATPAAAPATPAPAAAPATPAPAAAPETPAPAPVTK